ncbi:Toll/interleukin-1 receptor domain-containing protein [Tanacetum coccineum]
MWVSSPRKLVQRLLWIPDLGCSGRHVDNRCSPNIAIKEEASDEVLNKQTIYSNHLNMASSSSSGSYAYDVFLSFRGEDTRKTFVDHLYSALEQRLIRTYKDDITLPRGESVGPALAEKGLIVMPVFYDVDPSDVRKQKGDFGKAFSNKAAKSGRKLFTKQGVEDTTKVEVDSWKKALVDASNISGWEPKNVAYG